MWPHLLHPFTKQKKSTPTNNKTTRHITNSWLQLWFEVSGGGGFFLHVPPLQIFYRIKPTTPLGDSNSFWHTRTTSTPAVSVDQTPTCLQYTTSTTPALHPHLCACQTMVIIYCKRANISDGEYSKCGLGLTNKVPSQYWHFSLLCIYLGSLNVWMCVSSLNDEWQNKCRHVGIHTCMYECICVQRKGAWEVSAG